MKRSVFALLLALGCGPSPDQVSKDLHRLKSVAQQADARHREICTPPPPQVGYSAQKPEACAPLLDCLRLTGTATTRGTGLMETLAKGGLGAGASKQFEAARDAALLLCSGLNIKPQDAPTTPSAPAAEVPRG